MHQAHPLPFGLYFSYAPRILVGKIRQRPLDLPKSANSIRHDTGNRSRLWRGWAVSAAVAAALFPNGRVGIIPVVASTLHA
jgi:hypothetical protein